MTITKQHPVFLGNFFDDLLTQFPAAWGKDVSGNAFRAVPTNIHETSDAYHIELMAPGRNKDDFKIHLENGLLTISYEQKEESLKKDYKTIRKEFQHHSFKRSFSVDDKINVTGIQAKYENGVLKLLLPKKEEVIAQPQQIAIQ